MPVLCLTLVSFLSIVSVTASNGDRSKFYQDCVAECTSKQCSNRGRTSWSLWTCEEDCDYNCQWKTVDQFVRRGWDIPQFHGKWPFTRVLGMQEPASCIGSIMNMIIVSVLFKKFWDSVYGEAPYLYLWSFHTFASIFCWFWSTLYHARDTEFLEKMDYISASNLVMASFYCMTVRTLNLSWNLITAIWTIVCAIVAINHSCYLWFFKFDYSYNMAFNIIVGALAVSGWLIWAFVATLRGHPSPVKVATYCILLTIATLLEIFDFPPILWCFDAHAIWHWSTCFIVPFFYQFLEIDSLYLKSLLSTEKKIH